MHSPHYESPQQKIQPRDSPHVDEQVVREADRKIGSFRGSAPPFSTQTETTMKDDESKVLV
jgi:hypothetical protein